MTSEKELQEMGFGEIIELAEKLGWKDPDFLTNGKWTSNDCDDTEQSAIEFIIKNEGKQNVKK